MMSPPSQKSWWKAGLLVSASIVAALAVAELAVRLLAPQPTGLSHQDRFGLALHYPGITRYLPQYGHDVSFNSAGMRDGEHAPEKPAGVFRVLLLGDSFMEALQVPFEASLPSLLERSLTERTGKRVEVLNAGVSGWGTDDELRYLTEYGLRYQPDLVVVAMTLHNDISDNLRQEWHTLHNGALVTQAVTPMSPMRYKIVQLKAFLATRFQLYQLWRRARHGREIRQVGSQLQSHVVQLFLDPAPEKIAEGLDLTGHLLAAIRDTTTAAGGRVVVVLLPIIYQLSDTSFAGLVNSAGVPAQEMQIRKPQEVATRMADSLGIEVIDLLPRFRRWTAEGAAPLYLGWDGHWNSTGHRVAAEQITDQLVATGAMQ
jgi:hypothetical protein